MPSSEASRSRAASTRSAARCSSSGHSACRRASPSRRPARPRSHRTRVLHGWGAAEASARASMSPTMIAAMSRTRCARRRIRSTASRRRSAPLSSNGSVPATSMSRARRSSSTANRSRRWLHWSRPATTPAWRDQRCQSAAGTRRDDPDSPALRPSRPTTSARRKSWSARASRSRRARPATLPARGRTAAPLRGTPAAWRCSCTRRPYGSRVPNRMAMRSSGVPPRAASTTARTAARTSSSASDAVSTRVASPGSGAAGTSVAGGSTPTRASERRTPASAASAPVAPATTVVGQTSATATTRRACRCSRSCGR